MDMFEAAQNQMNAEGPDWCEHGMDSSCLECQLTQQQRLLDQQEAEAVEMQELLFALEDFEWLLNDYVPTKSFTRLTQWWKKYRPSIPAREE